MLKNKKLVSLVMALVMLFTLTVPAMAETASQDERRGPVPRVQFIDWKM